ncbi:hypothetical protein RQP46_004242 [Phenoliferia psychrophenolica]
MPEEPAAAPTVSSTFNSPNADITLLSKDNTLFKVHRANLAAHSATFAGMFETMDGGGDNTITLSDESAEDLELILPYFHPRAVKPIEIAFPEIWRSVHLASKFQIFRLMDAIDIGLRWVPFSPIMSGQ